MNRLNLTKRAFWLVPIIVAFAGRGSCRDTTDSKDQYTPPQTPVSADEPVDMATLTGHSDFVVTLAFSQDGRLLVSGSKRLDEKLSKQPFVGEIKFWDVETRKEFATILGHTGFVTGVALTPDGTILASGSFDQTVKLWNVKSGKEIITLKGHTAPVNSIAISPDGKILASAGTDRTIKLWDLAKKEETASLKGHTGDIDSIRFSPDGSLLASGGGGEP